MQSLVVAGDLGFLLDTAEVMGSKLPSFMAAYRKLIRRYMHSRPVFTKYFGDQFVYVYEASSARFNRNVLHSMMVLSGAFDEAIAKESKGFEGLHDAMPEPHALGLGMSAGPLVVLPRSRDMDEDFIGLPMYTAKEMADEAGALSGHILIDPVLELDRLCREWLKIDDAGGLALHDMLDSRQQAQIVTPASVMREFRSDRERYQVINIAEAFKEDIDKIARADVFSFRMRDGARPHMELIFNPTNYREPFEKSEPTSILMVYMTPSTMTMLPEMLVPSDRVYAVQIPVQPVQGYQIMFGLALQAPETDLIEDELRTISETDVIAERLEALRRLLKRARLLKKLSTAYYRF